jgi:hypothetical protein
MLACMSVIKAEMMFLGRSGFGGRVGIAGGDNRQNHKSATESECNDCLQQAKPPIQQSVKRKENCQQTTILAEDGIKAKFGR